MIIPDEMHTLATRAEEHADKLFADLPDHSPDGPEMVAWRSGYAVAYARAVAHMAHWCLGDGTSDNLRELTDVLEVEVL